MIKVFHAARQDIEIGRQSRRSGSGHPIFDTQVAAMVCRFRRIDLLMSQLVSRITGAPIDQVLPVYRLEPQAALRTSSSIMRWPTYTHSALDVYLVEGSVSRLEADEGRAPLALTDENGSRSNRAPPTEMDTRGMPGSGSRCRVKKPVELCVPQFSRLRPGAKREAQEPQRSPRRPG